ncbi:DUF2958 domain-containing protein [[Clostridium] spiroforme]|nr:DUF2958 domain-containing protein [Thomasclavelia spiroformis]
MELINKQIEKKLNQYGLYGQENIGFDSKILVKYFNPYGYGTWLITGAEQIEDDDWLLFGFVSLLTNEWGYVMLSELESLKLAGQIPLIERDLYINENTTVRQECRSLGISI